MAVAGRCGRRLKRSSRRSPSVRARPPHLDQRQGRGDRQDEERAHADGPADRRQPEPEPEPGQSKEQARQPSPSRPAPATAAPTGSPPAPGTARGRAWPLPRGRDGGLQGFRRSFRSSRPCDKILKGQYLTTEPVPGYGAWRFPKQFARHRDGKATDPAGQSQPESDRARSIGRLQGGAGPAPIRYPGQALPGSRPGCCRCRTGPPRRPRPS